KHPNRFPVLARNSFRPFWLRRHRGRRIAGVPPRVEPWRSSKRSQENQANQRGLERAFHADRRLHSNRAVEVISGVSRRVRTIALIESSLVEDISRVHEEAYVPGKLILYADVHARKRQSIVEAIRQRATGEPLSL